MAINVENKFELNQVVYAKKEDNSLVRGEVQYISSVMSNDNKTPKLRYGVQMTNGKNIRTIEFGGDCVFATAEDAFGVVPIN